jgi:hypothetical protein
MKPIVLPIAPPGYRPQSADCSIEADLLQFELLRRWSPTKRLIQAASLIRSARQLSLNAHRQRFPELTTPELAQRLAHAWLQEYCPLNYIPTGTEMTWIQDSIQLAIQLHDLFTTNGIDYYVTGGVAAVAYGETRTTQDLDVVLSVDLTELSRVAGIFEAAGFYVSGLDDVIASRMSSFQVTEIATISRADLMIASSTEYSRTQLSRRQTIPISADKLVYFASPEDVIINKLIWGRGSQSEKQWRDVLSIMKTQRESLDYEYIREWAGKLELMPLYTQATIEAGVSTFENDNREP